MRILHIDTAREWRGGQTQLLYLVRAMSQPSAVVLAPDSPLRTAIPEALTADFGSPLMTPPGLREAFARFRPDIVAAHTSHAHGHAVRISSCPVVVHRRLDFAPKLLSQGKYRAAAGYVAVSHAVSRVLQAAGVPSERIDVVHDGVEVPIGEGDPDLRRVLGIPSDTVLVLAIGALVPHKGHSFLADAIAQLPERFHCLIAGSGELGEALQGRERLHLLGERGDVGRLLRSCDLFCHPSVGEGMGQAVAEALLAPIRVVATTAGGIPEVVGSDGVLVEPGSSDALAAGILEALERDMHDPARVARDFSVETMLRGTERAYRRYAELG